MFRSGITRSKWKWSVRLFATPWTVAYQVPLSMEFSRQEYWSGWPFPSPEDLPNPGIEPGSPTLQADALPSEPPGKPTESKARATFKDLGIDGKLIFGILKVCPQEQHVWMYISLDFPALSCIHLSFQNCIQGNSLAVQRLGLHGLTAKSLGLIPGQGAKILQAKQHSQGQGENNCIQSTVFLFFFHLFLLVGG